MDPQKTRMCCSFGVTSHEVFFYCKLDHKCATYLNIKKLHFSHSVSVFHVILTITAIVSLNAISQFVFLMETLFTVKLELHFRRL
jgi:hypothetical protein